MTFIGIMLKGLSDEFNLPRGYCIRVIRSMMSIGSVVINCISVTIQKKERS